MVSPIRPAQAGLWTHSELRDGLTLLELLIVMTILAVLATFSIPSFLNAKKGAAGARTVGVMKQVITANQQYHLRFRSYAGNEANLVDIGLIEGFNTSPNPAYNFTYTGAVNSWSLLATPREPGITADNSFYVDATGVIRISAAGPATPASTPLK